MVKLWRLSCFSLESFPALRRNVPGQRHVTGCPGGLHRERHRHVSRRDQSNRPCGLSYLQGVPRRISFRGKTVALPSDVHQLMPADADISLAPSNGLIVAGALVGSDAVLVEQQYMGTTLPGRTRMAAAARHALAVDHKNTASLITSIKLVSGMEDSLPGVDCLPTAWRGCVV